MTSPADPPRRTADATMERIRMLAAKFDTAARAYEGSVFRELVESDLRHLVAADRAARPEEPNWQQMFTDEQNAHKLTAETLTKNLRDVAKLEQYRVERDQARQQLRAVDRAARPEQVARVGEGFPDGSYDIPLEFRLDLRDFSHPRLGITSTGKHSVPLTTEEGQRLLALLRAAARPGGAWREDERVKRARKAFDDRLGDWVDVDTQRAETQSHLTSDQALDALCDAVAACAAGPVAEPPTEDDVSGNPKFAQSFDAQVWAKAWLRIYGSNPSIAADEGTMISWFANALMRGYDHARAESAAPSGASTTGEKLPEWLASAVAFLRVGSFDIAAMRDDVRVRLADWIESRSPAPSASGPTGETT